MAVLLSDDEGPNGRSLGALRQPRDDERARGAGPQLGEAQRPPGGDRARLCGTLSDASPFRFSPRAFAALVGGGDRPCVFA